MNFSKLELDVCEIVNNNLDNIFSDLTKLYDIKTGDMSPEDTDTLLNAIEDIEGVCVRWVKNNKGGAI